MRSVFAGKIVPCGVNVFAYFLLLATSMHKTVLVSLIVVVCWPTGMTSLTGGDEEQLIGGVQSYERINYSLRDVMGQLIKSSNSEVKITFNAFQRVFSLILRQTRGLIAPRAKMRVLSSEGEEGFQFNSKELYTGYIEGDPHSSINGRISAGLFDGSLYTDGQTFYLEPAIRYIPLPTPSFHSIMFVSSSVNFSSSKIRLDGVRPLNKPKDKFKVNFKQGKWSRHRRTSGSLNSTNTQTSCALHIAADHLFLEHVAAGSESSAVVEMVYHVIEVDKIFRATDFNGDGGPGDNYGFVVAAVTVFKDSTAGGSMGSYQGDDMYDFLTEWSLFNNDDYCLALLFTYRDFNEGVLGLAWVGDPNMDSPGGICSKGVTLQSTGERLNFNTAVVSFLNYGTRVPRAVSVAMVAHELGHNFGAEHDPATSVCSPGGSAGNYVMYSRASDGTRPYNFRFSVCSKESMWPVIRNKGPLCFIDHNNGSYCGNKIVNEGEECDCGLPEECDHVDPCCVARNDEKGITGCLLRPSMQCSPKSGPCCTSDCKFVAKSKELVCKTELECSLCSKCNGKTGGCPKPTPKPNNRTCNGGANSCVDGACTGSVCAQLGLSECDCTDSDEEMCHVCCIANQGRCISSKVLFGIIIQKSAGRTCRNLQGYCTLSGQCVTMNLDNQLYRLKHAFKRLLSKQSLNHSWLKRNWYYIVAAVFVLCFALVIWKLIQRRQISPFFLAFHATGNRASPQQQEGLQMQESSDEYGINTAFDWQESWGEGNDVEAGQAMDRLQQLFPDVERITLASSIRYSTDEGTAMNRLLAQGFKANQGAAPLPALQSNTADTCDAKARGHVNSEV